MQKRLNRSSWCLRVDPLDVVLILTGHTGPNGCMIVQRRQWGIKVDSTDPGVHGEHLTPRAYSAVFSARCNLALMLRCQCPSVCPSVCDGSALAQLI